MNDHQWREFSLSAAWGGLYASMIGNPFPIALLAWRGHLGGAAWLAFLSLALYAEVLWFFRTGRLEWPQP